MNLCGHGALSLLVPQPHHRVERIPRIGLWGMSVEEFYAPAGMHRAMSRKMGWHRALLRLAELR